MKKWFLITGLLLVFFPSMAQAEDYCEDFNQRNVYEEAYCKLRLDSNKEREATVLKAVAHQMGYEEGLTRWMFEQDQFLTCQDIASYSEKNNLERSEWHEDIKAACLQEDSETIIQVNRDAFTRLLNRLGLAYAKEHALESSKVRLEETFKSSERYWDGKLEASTPFDLMVDLNLMDDLIFGSQAQWVHDSFVFPTIEKEGDEQDPLPPINLLPEDEDAQEDDLPPIPGDEGVDLNLEEAFVHPDCLDQKIDPFPLCGNGVVDVLAGETCDDGNKVDGDGCNSNCQITPGSLQCKDPQAVNLQAFAALPLGEKNNPLCPPAILGEKAMNPEEQNQKNETPALNIFNTPSSSIGGTLSPLPTVNPPQCPAGHKVVKVSMAGKESISQCIRTDFCGDFNQIRNHLFGEGWEEGDQADLAASIETAVCVNFSTQNRPTTPYAMNEGCIDCHFRAMADALEKALAGNVTPLANTTSAFALSSPWGPTFSLDLNVSVKGLPSLDRHQKNPPSPEAQEADKKSDKDTQTVMEQAGAEAKEGESSLSGPLVPTEAVIRKTNDTKAQLESISENLENYRTLSSAQSDFNMATQVSTQIDYLSRRFGNIQNSVSSMASHAKDLSTKKTCEL